MIGRREFLSKTFKTIVGGTLILLPVPKTVYSFPANIVLPTLYHISAYDHVDYNFHATGAIRIFPDRLDRVGGEAEVVKLLQGLKIYDKYTSWHFVEVSPSLKADARAFIWSKHIEPTFMDKVKLGLPYDTKYNEEEVR